MDKEDLLKKEIVIQSEIDDYIKEKGINNIKSKDLETLFNKLDSGFLSSTEVYKIVSMKETNQKNDENAKIMGRWTRIVGWLTVITTIATIVSLIISILG